jgi:hypothetical protein
MVIMACNALSSVPTQISSCTQAEGHAMSPEKDNKAVIAAIIAAVAAISGAVISQPYFQQKLIEPHFCDRKFEFQAPTTGQPIDGSIGVVVIGKTCGYDAEDDRGWIFDFDPEDKTFYSVSEEPLAGREWALFDGPVGNQGDVKKKYSIVVFRADEACNTTLLNLIAKGEGETNFKQPPPGCSEDDRRDIIVTYKLPTGVGASK